MQKVVETVGNVANTYNAFSVLDTGRGGVESYYFDTSKPDSEVVLFDEFEL